MKNFIFKSTDADLQKVITIISSELNLLQKNILYITYRIDSVLKIVKEQQTDKGLQKQVDEYFQEAPPEEVDHLWWCFLLSLKWHGVLHQLLLRLSKDITSMSPSYSIKHIKAYHQRLVMECGMDMSPEVL